MAFLMKIRRNKKGNIPGLSSILKLILGIVVFLAVMYILLKSTGLLNAAERYTSTNKCIQDGRTEDKFSKEINDILLQSVSSSEDARPELNRQAAGKFAEFGDCYLQELPITSDKFRKSTTKIKLAAGIYKIYLADGLYDINRPDYALYFYNLYYDNNAGENDALEKRALYMAGKIYFNNGDYQNASDKLSILLGKDRNYADDIGLMTGIAKVKLGKKTSEGLSDLQSYYSQHAGDSNGVAAAFFLGNYYYTQKDYDASTGWLEKVKDSGVPESATAQQMIAFSYWDRSKQADSQAEKRSLLEQAISEFGKYSGVALQAGMATWESSRQDFMMLEMCKAQEELALYVSDAEKKKAYEDAIDSCQFIIDHYTGSVNIEEARRTIAEIKAKCTGC
jgi:hypothetical protein